MIEVRKAYADDYLEVLPLLLKFNSSIDTWRKLFTNHWQHPENYFGFVLTDSGKVIGYLGTIFSERLIKGKNEKFCNLSTWIIDENYNKHGLSLFLPVLELEGYTVTNFSSADKTYVISKKLGFEDLGSDLRFISPWPKIRLNKDIEVFTQKESLAVFLEEPDRKIWQDHNSFNCIHIVLRKGTETCYLILKKKRADLKVIYYLNRVINVIFKSNIIRDKAFLGQIHYVSNKVLFAQVIDAVSWQLSWKFGLLGLLCEASWLGEKAKDKKSFKVFSTPLFKSQTVNRENIDSLYSETFVLNIE